MIEAPLSTKFHGAEKIKPTVHLVNRCSHKKVIKLMSYWMNKRIYQGLLDSIFWKINKLKSFKNNYDINC